MYDKLEIITLIYYDDFSNKNIMRLFLKCRLWLSLMWEEKTEL